MNTIMGWHVSVIVQAVELFVALHALRLLITWAYRKVTPPRPVVVVPDPTVDRHEAFPYEDNVVDLAAARARRV